MRNILKLWRGRPRLGRRGKIAVNLLAAAVAACLLWAAAGYPLPTVEMEFRRMERTRLLPRSEIVFAAAKGGQDQPVYALDGTELWLRGGPWFAGVGEEHAVLACADHESWKRDLTAVPLDREGAALLVFPAGYGYWREEAPPGFHRETHNFFPLLLVDVPEETARAEITVTKNSVSVTGPGWDMGKGVWLLTPDNQVLPYQSSLERTYILRLYRTDGSLLLEKSGTLGEG